MTDCIYTRFSSRTCERGTNGCNVRHDEEPQDWRTRALAAEAALGEACKREAQTIEAVADAASLREAALRARHAEAVEEQRQSAARALEALGAERDRAVVGRDYFAERDDAAETRAADAEAIANEAMRVGAEALAESERRRDRAYRSVYAVGPWAEGLAPLVETLGDPRATTATVSLSLRSDEPPWSITAQREGGKTPTERLAELTAERDAMRMELDELRANRPPWQRCADMLADEVDALIKRRVIDSRSPAADALLDYRERPRSPRSDRLGAAELAADGARAECDAATADAGALRAAVARLKTTVEAELARGYVLSHEPAAGSAWRARWNGILGDVEFALSGSAGRELAEEVGRLRRVAEAARAVMFSADGSTRDWPIGAYEYPHPPGSKSPFYEEEMAALEALKVALGAGATRETT